MHHSAPCRTSRLFPMTRHFPSLPASLMTKPGPLNRARELMLRAGFFPLPGSHQLGPLAESYCALGNSYFRPSFGLRL